MRVTVSFTKAPSTSYNPQAGAVAIAVARQAEALVLGWGDTASMRAGCSKNTAGGQGAGTLPALS